MRQFLRTHSTVVFNRPSGLVSPGYAFRWRKRREAAERGREAYREQLRAASNNPDNPALTAKRRLELREQLNRRAQGGAGEALPQAAEPAELS